MSAIPFTDHEIDILRANGYEIDTPEGADQIHGFSYITKRSIGYCKSVWYDDDECGYWSDCDVYASLEKAIEG